MKILFSNKYYFSPFLLLIIVGIIQTIILLNTFHSNPNALYWSEDSYRNAAINLLDYEVFSTETGTHTKTHEIVRTPGYPLIIAAIYALTDRSHIAFIFFQSILSLATCYFIYLLSLQLFYDKTSAFMAMFMYAISLNRMHLMSFDSDETVSIFLILLSIIFINIYLNRFYNLTYLFYASITLSFASLCRPTLVYIPYFIYAILVLNIIIIKEYKFLQYYKIIFKVTIIFILPILLTVNIWSYRNYIHTGVFEFTTNYGYSMYWFFGQYIHDNKAGLIKDKTHLRKNLESLNFKTLSASDKSALLKKEGIKLIIQNPLRYLKVHMRGLVERLYLDLGTPFFLTQDLLNKKLLIARNLDIYSMPDLIRKVRPVALLYSYYNNGLYNVVITKIYSLIWYMTIYSCFLLYFVKIKKIQVHIIIILALILFHWNIAGPLLNGRYRAPMESLLTIIAMQGIWLSIKGKKIF